MLFRDLADVEDRLYAKDDTERTKSTNQFEDIHADKDKLSL